MQQIENYTLYQLQSVTYTTGMEPLTYFKELLFIFLPFGCLLSTGSVDPEDRESCLVVLVGAERYSAC